MELSAASVEMTNVCDSEKEERATAKSTVVWRRERHGEKRVSPLRGDCEGWGTLMLWLGWFKNRQRQKQMRGFFPFDSPCSLRVRMTNV